MGTSWLGGASIFLLVVIEIATALSLSHLLLGHRRRSELVLVERDEVANDPIVKLECALVFGKRGRLGAEARDDVIASVAAADLVRELAATPVRELDVGRLAEQSVKAVELVGNGGIFERGVEDIHRLILACHAVAILPFVYRLPKVADPGGEWLSSARLANVTDTYPQARGTHTRRGLSQSIVRGTRHPTVPPTSFHL